MKKPLLIGVSALTLLASATLLFAQTTTGSSLITEMKAAVRVFTLAGDLNPPGTTGLQSAPVSGKKTGDMRSQQVSGIVSLNSSHRVAEVAAEELR